jgi:hypothetical protein
MTPMGPGIPTETRPFALAAFVARTIVWALAFVTVIGGAALTISQGPEAGFGLAARILPEVLVNGGLAYFLHRSSRIAAVLFALWCLWGLASSVQGHEDTLTALLVYAFGVLNFIGLAAVVKGFLNWKAT